MEAPSANAAPGSTVVVAAHQPNFLPWLGYFYKLRNADIFLVVDNVQFSKGSYTNRVRVPMGGKTNWMTVPVQIPGSEALITEITIPSTKFVRQHLNTIRATYGKSPYFQEVFALLEPVYLAVATGHRLDHFNLSLITNIASYLGLDVRMERISDLGIDGRNNEMLSDATAAVGGGLYVAGRGARSYMEGHESVYASRGVEIAYQRFEHPVYPQKLEPFEPGCSIIDAMFQLGQETRTLLEPQGTPPWTPPEV